MTESIDRDFRILAESFRAASDVAAWDALVRAWCDKILDLQIPDARFEGGERLAEHYAELREMLSQLFRATSQAPIEHAVERTGSAAMVVDTAHRVVLLNASARTRFGVEQGQLVGESWLAPDDVDVWRQFVRHAARANSGRILLRVIVDGDRVGIAEVAAIHSPAHSHASFAVTVIDHPWSAEVEAMLERAFGLTGAELDICRLLMDGHSPRTMAAMRGVSERTVRVQLSAIFQKTNSASQVALVRLLALLAAHLAPSPNAKDLSWTDPSGRTKRMRRPDGRILSHNWIGAPDGKPAILLPWLAGGTLFPPVFEAELLRANICLHMLHRPGTGYSEHDPKIAPVDDHQAMVREFCAAEGLSGVLAIGHHAASIPLAELATQADCPLSAILCLGRFTAYVPERITKLHFMSGTLTWLAINAPWAVEVIGKLATRALEQNGPDWYLDRVFAALPGDLATARSAEGAAMLRNGVLFNFHQGTEAFFDDLRMRASDFTGSLAKLQRPFHWWIGDISPTPIAGQRPYFDATEEAQIASLNPRIRFDTICGASELFFYQQPEATAARIAELVERYSR
ncbi:LuxR C-terminal-related transcriptional regulator [Sphingomonas sp. ST-64]|uniref:LuxR C-terminal-related transcriptional regulator n=2 Tax=Sphingomonas plantiphila TaxID=3163295 RepID=A0ABW8YKT6_9SPHN